jgi:hypothetical protein
VYDALVLARAQFEALPPGCRNDKLLGGQPSLRSRLRSRGESGSVPSLESTEVMSIGGCARPHSPMSLRRQMSSLPSVAELGE